MGPLVLLAVIAGAAIVASSVVKGTSEPPTPQPPPVPPPPSPPPGPSSGPLPQAGLTPPDGWKAASRPLGAGKRYRAEAQVYGGLTDADLVASLGDWTGVVLYYPFGADPLGWQPPERYVRWEGVYLGTEQGTSSYAIRSSQTGEYTGSILVMLGLWEVAA